MDLANAAANPGDAAGDILTGIEDVRGSALADTIRGFKEIIEGKHDDIPEQAFYMKGGIEEVVAAAKEMASA